MQTRTPTSTTPSRTTRRATKRRSAPPRNVRRGAAVIGGVSARPGSALATPQPDARVEHSVQHVDNEIGEYDGDAGQQDERLKHEVLPPKDGIHHQAAHARDTEDGFGNDCA